MTILINHKRNIFNLQGGGKLGTLKVITVIAPALFIGIFEFLRHRLSVDAGALAIGNAVVFLVVLFGAFLFSRIIFGIIEKMQQENLRQNQELTILNSVALAVSESLNMDTILYRALDKILQITESDAGEIFLRDESTQEMTPRVHTGQSPEAIKEISGFQVSRKVVSTIAENGKPVMIEDLTSDETLAPDYNLQNTFRSLVGIPLRMKNSVFGVLILATMKPHVFDERGIQLLDNIGNRIAVAVENARLYEKVQDLAVLEERERIAREMHDSLAQVLSYVIIKSQATRQILQDGKIEEALTDLQETENIARDTYDDVREAILGLRSTDTLRKGLVGTLKEYVLRFSQLNKLKVDLQIDDSVAGSFPTGTEIQVIRIIQEALTNVRKHAQAARVWVQVSRDGDMGVVTVKDNGKGFNLSRLKRGTWPQFGLQTMKERAESVMGTLEIHAMPGSGSEIRLRIPICDASAERMKK